MSIGFIDSGIGGLTTLCECIKAYPNKDYIYIADTLYAPYGSKDNNFLLKRANTLITMLKERGAKAIIFACNTCSSSTAEKDLSCLPVIRVLPPVERALSQTSGKVLLLATPATIRSKYIREINNQRLFKVENEHLAMLIENSAPDFFKLKQYLRDILLPFSDCQAIIPGCTHYLFLTDIIKEILPHIKIYHSNLDVVKELSFLEPDINYSTRKIIITGQGNEQDYVKLLNDLLNN